MGKWDTVNRHHLAGQIQTQTESDFSSGPFQYVRTEVAWYVYPVGECKNLFMEAQSIPNFHHLAPTYP